jgi:hypothetical protein
MTEYTFIVQPQSSEYIAMLNDLTHFAVDASVVVDDYGRRWHSADSDYSVVLQKLSSYLKATRRVVEWPGTQLYGDAQADCYHYEYCAGLVGLLTSLADALFDWQMPLFPQDLALCRTDGSDILATVSHEGWGCIGLKPEEIAIVQHRAWFSTISQFSLVEGDPLGVGVVRQAEVDIDVTQLGLGGGKEHYPAGFVPPEACYLRIASVRSGIYLLLYDWRWRLLLKRTYGSIAVAQEYAQGEFGVPLEEWEYVFDYVAEK